MRLLLVEDNERFAVLLKRGRRGRVCRWRIVDGGGRYCGVAREPI
jgi:hypothetical protein